MIETITGIAAGVLTSASMVPQLIKVLKTRDVEDISPVMLSILIAGVSLWVVYGLMKDELPIVLSNAFAVVVNTCLLICYFIYREKKGKG